ncbi:MAG: hypothetical protein ACYTAF_07685 [Planctomycetota bacterium]
MLHATARFVEASLVDEDERSGAMLGFVPRGPRIDPGRIDDFADLGPALTVRAVRGLGKVLRLLRAARIAVPVEPLGLVGSAPAAVELLDRAVGTMVHLALRPRTRLTFVAWTEGGVEVVPDVEEVLEDATGYLVRRRRGRTPVLFERAAVVRQKTERERWHEVLDIERA